MLQTIEVEIDNCGRIHPLEPLSFIPAGRAYLTLLPSAQPEKIGSGSAAQALELLASPRFAQRPKATPSEVQQRIEDLRNDWNGN